MTQLIHCSYHKCLTVYFKRVLGSALSHFGGYHHFNSDVDAFYGSLGDYRVSSVNNHALRLDQLGEYRITRFVRDPRDLVVSGYFYHRKGVERWCHVVDPSAEDWLVVNGRRPGAMEPGESLTECLQRLDTEDGLIAEIEFRSDHFESMREWPDVDPRIKTWRYEDILGHEEKVFNEVADHYGLPLPVRLNMRRFATRYKAGKISGENAQHVRDPKAGQWHSVFTPKVQAVFDERFGDLPAALGYE